MIKNRTSRTVRACPTLAAAAVAVALAGTAAPSYAEGLEEVVVTAQRRETALQTTPISISAYSGEAIAEGKLFTPADLAASVPGFSLTAGTPLDVELNIRGITNTRLDSPSADPSVGTFIDGIYMGRTGDLNYDFYDLERVEVIRGPQGVLLGKNVVGGALSISTARPKFESDGNVTVGYGNYQAKFLSGFVTGALSDTVAGRLSLQVRDRAGYARDVLHNRDVDDLNSIQARAQLLYKSADSDWTVRGILNYNRDKTNGINVVAVDGGTPSCETSYLRTNCTRPWSNLRSYLGMTDPRENRASHFTFKGETDPTAQFLRRKGMALTLDIQRDFEGFTFNSLTGYTNGDSGQIYDQTGIGPEALGWSITNWQAYIAALNTKYGTRPATSNNGQFLFAQPVNEYVDATQFSQEFRLTSDNDSRLDWIVGAYFKKDKIDKTDRFIGENFLGAVITGGNNPLSTLSGENKWVNKGKIENVAGFASLGFKFTDTLKLSAGLRYTQDKKSGTVVGTVVATGDRFNPNDPRPNVTIEGLCRRPDNTVVSPTPATCVAPNRWVYAAGDSFTAPYSAKWSKSTPQVTLDWRPSEDTFVYVTYAKGFKGGGFDDTPANPSQASTPYDPEEADNYELGFKTTLLDRRLRFNTAIFKMDYKNLQVTQTNAACLCNLTDNAASASIKGIEAELEFLPLESLRFSLSGSYVDTKYEDFLETAINPSTGTRLDSSGNRLQRTPEKQVSAGVDYTAGIGGWGQALKFSLNYSWQSDLFWATDNIAKEPSYGLLDARIALAPEGKPWSVALWGKNLNDELYRTNIISFFGEEVSQYGAPRTYGLDLSWKF
ncbi:MAG: TonB-dependent receptor [Gammaproteobacteria bacterium]|nr:TonB-dependent receptor [Gammaproteobacteria bacterium]